MEQKAVLLIHRLGKGYFYTTDGSWFKPGESVTNGKDITKIIAGVSDKYLGTTPFGEPVYRDGYVVVEDDVFKEGETIYKLWNTTP